MTDKNYYGSLFKSNGTSVAVTGDPTRFDATLPHLERRGIRGTAFGTVVFAAAIATSDAIFLARVPAGHRVTGLRFRFPELDSGSTVTVNVGVQAAGTTYDDADAYIAASTLFRLLAHRSFPTGTTDIAKDAPTTWWTGPGGAGTPDVDYNVVMVLAAGPTTATSGTIYYEIDYVAEVTPLDDYASPSAVLGTQ